MFKKKDLVIAMALAMSVSQVGLGQTTESPEAPAAEAPAAEAPAAEAPAADDAAAEKPADTDS
ncbi:MAG: hypothetical protein HOG02_09365 [Porticoccaceae bacterium]|nr:hypothetical protein [Porticoccaceae bacterium]